MPRNSSYETHARLWAPRGSATGILDVSIAKAHSEGKYRGRAPTARAKADQVFALDRAGKTREAIAKEVGISLVSVYRILRTRKDAEKAPRRD